MKVEDRNYGCLPTFGSPVDLSSLFESLNCTASVVSNSNMHGTVCYQLGFSKGFCVGVRV